jgi:hypothetical protein
MAIAVGEVPYRVDASNQAGWRRPIDDLRGPTHLRQPAKIPRQEAANARNVVALHLADKVAVRLCHRTALHPLGLASRPGMAPRTRVMPRVSWHRLRDSL